MVKRTLENYCHNEVITAKSKCSDGSRKLQGCPLFGTKSDNIGESLAHSVDTAEQFRNFKELGLLPPLTQISAYEFTCLDAAERAVRRITDEQNKKAMKSDKKRNQSELPSGIGERPQGKRFGNREKMTGGGR